MPPGLADTWVGTGRREEDPPTDLEPGATGRHPRPYGLETLREVDSRQSKGEFVSVQILLTYPIKLYETTTLYALNRSRTPVGKTRDDTD